MERRSDSRASVSLMGALQLAGEAEAPAVVLDLSAGGVRIQVDSPPNPEHEYQLHFNVHRVSYSPRVRVVHWDGSGGAYRWGCTFFDLPEELRGSLRQTVHAASGAAGLTLRPWPEVLAVARTDPTTHVTVGAAPSGREITLLGQDCLDIGQEGVELFVHTVAGLESA